MSDKPYPDTIEELIERCEKLISRCDLYTLGAPNDTDGSDYRKDWPDGTQDLSGEWLYGVGMIPAQWVTHVLCKEDGDMR